MTTVARLINHYNILFQKQCLLCELAFVGADVVVEDWLMVGVKVVVSDFLGVDVLEPDKFRKWPKYFQK